MSFGLKSVPFGPKWLDSVISLVLVMVQFQKNWLLFKEDFHFGEQLEALVQGCTITSTSASVLNFRFQNKESLITMMEKRSRIEPTDMLFTHPRKKAVSCMNEIRHLEN